MFLYMVVIVRSHNHHHDKEIKECGTVAPSRAMAAWDIARGDLFKKKHGRRDQAQSCADLCKQCIEIEVAVHYLLFAGKDFNLDFDFIPHPTATADYVIESNDTSLTAGNFTSIEDMALLAKKQIDLMNEKYADTPFYFTHMERDTVTVNTDWARYARVYSFDMWAALSTRDLLTLNLYLAYTPVWINKNVIAFSRFPSNQAQDGDGIYQYVMLSLSEHFSSQPKYNSHFVILKPGDTIAFQVGEM